MRKLCLSAERLVDAPADVVYRCIADYRTHHRPGGFLPPAFSEMRIERGGVGAGTVITFKMTLAGASRSMTRAVSEPEPGRVLVEADALDQTTFTVEPVGQQCRVRLDTLLATSGFQGIFMRLLAPRLLKPVYADELQRLERHAQAQIALAA